MTTAKRVKCERCGHYHPAVHQRDVCGYILSGGAFGAVICACPLVSNKPEIKRETK